MTANAKLSGTAADLGFALTITNNDSDPANTLQADLTWSTGTGTSIDNADLDLFLQYNVPVDGSGNPSGLGTTYHSSQATTGFETVPVASTDTDQVYWFAVPYIAGAGAVDFTFTLNGFGWNNVSGTGHFSATDAGAASVFFGPFTKTGTTFPQGRTMFLVPKGGIKSTLINNFPLTQK